MELLLPYLLIILGAPVSGQIDRPVEEVRVAMSMEACEAMRRKIRFDGGASRTPREMICAPFPSDEDFERAFQEVL